MIMAVSPTLYLASSACTGIEKSSAQLKSKDKIRALPLCMVDVLMIKPPVFQAANSVIVNQFSLPQTRQIMQQMRQN